MDMNILSCAQNVEKVLQPEMQLQKRNISKLIVALADCGIIHIDIPSSLIIYLRLNKKYEIYCINSTKEYVKEEDYIH